MTKTDNRKRTFFDWWAYLDNEEEMYQDFCECNGIPEDERSDDDMWSFICDEMRMDWDDFEYFAKEKYIDGQIICIGDLGFWYGRRDGWKTLGSCVADCLSVTGRDGWDRAQLYIDADNNFCAVNTDHDGTSYFTFYKFTCDEEELEEKLENGEDVSGYLLPLGDDLIDLY